MTACFDTEQPSARIVEQGKVYVFIALNGRWTNRQVENGQEPQACWECDYAEIVCEKDQIDLDDVRENPGKYLDWEPPAKKTSEEEIADLKEKNRMLTECLIEMSELVYA